MPTRPIVDNAQIPLMRRGEILVDGYPMALASSFSSDLSIDDQSFDIYGYEQQMTTRVLKGALLQMTLIMDRSTETLFSIGTGQDPASTALKGFMACDDVRLDVIRNVRNAAGTGYEAAEYYPAWAPVMRDPQGAPGAMGTVRLDGPCRLPTHLVAARGKNVAIVTDVVSMVGTSQKDMAFGICPGMTLPIPSAKGSPHTQSYAFGIEAQSRDGANKILRSARMLMNSMATGPYRMRLTTAGVTTNTNIYVDNNLQLPVSGGKVILNGTDYYDVSFSLPTQRRISLLTGLTKGYPVGTTVDNTASLTVTSLLVDHDDGYISVSSADAGKLPSYGFLYNSGEWIWYDSLNTGTGDIHVGRRALNGTAPYYFQVGDEFEAWAPNIFLQRTDLTALGLYPDDPTWLSSGRLPVTHAYVTYPTESAGLVGSGLVTKGRYDP